MTIFAYYLSIEDVPVDINSTLEEVVGSPFDSSPEVVHLLAIRLGELYTTPGHLGHGESHREVELDIVTS